MGLCPPKGQDPDLPISGQTPVPPPGSLHKPLDQPYLPGGRNQKQEKLQSCNLQNGHHKHGKLDKMRKSRHMFQMKEQDKTPELSKVETGDLLEKEFRLMRVNVIHNLRKRM